MSKFLDTLKSAFSKMKPFFDIVKKLCKKYGDIVIPTAVLSTICIVVTLALSSTNLLTLERINELAEQNKNEAMSKLIKAETYSSATEKFGDEEIAYNTALNGEKTLGYIFTINSKGYGGDVIVMTAVNTDGTVAAVDILDASGETPGLGQNVTKDSFYEQYTYLKNDITVNKTQANKEENQIKAVTGATISSKAVTQAVNKALEYAAQIIAKEAVK